MRAIWIRRHGGHDALEVRETADPQPKPGEVRVRVHAAGLNFAEVSARQGLYPDAPKPPCIVGYEGAGVVEAHGEGVTSPALGTRVYFLSRFGAHADVVCVPSGQARPIPDELSFEHAAAMPVNYLTAYFMLFRIGQLRPKQRVLVHMAAGGVGTAVLQLARTVEGVTIFGSASAPKHEYLRALGCDETIDSRTQDYVTEVRRRTGGEGVDLVLDAVGGAEWRRGYGLLREGGMLICFGLSSAQRGERPNWLRVIWQVLRIPWFHPNSLMSDNRAVAGVNLGRMWHRPELIEDGLEQVLGYWRAGVARPQIDSVFPFARAAEAHARIERGENRGKIILTP